jgi:hypothetical protein
MSFRAKREILRWQYIENRRFLPVVEMTDSLSTTFYEAINFVDSHLPAEASAQAGRVPLGSAVRIGRRTLFAGCLNGSWAA